MQNTRSLTDMSSFDDLESFNAQCRLLPQVVTGSGWASDFGEHMADTANT